MIVLGIVAICNLWVIVASFIQCIPLEAVWNPSVPGWCLEASRVASNSIIHIVTDFMIFVLPLPALWKLNIYWKEKIALIGVFSLGFLYVITTPDGSAEQLTCSSVCLISILRLVSVHIDSSDITYDFSLRA